MIRVCFFRQKLPLTFKFAHGGVYAVNPDVPADSATSPTDSLVDHSNLKEVSKMGNVLLDSIPKLFYHPSYILRL